ncbi:MAG: lytic transglycosylase domain-containing protein [Bacteroidota bacterium]
MENRPNKKSLIKKTALSLLFILCVIFITSALTFSVENKNDSNNDTNYRKHVAENYKIFSLATPEGLDFSGEAVPLEDIDIRERLDKELVINTYWHSSTLFLLKRANRWFPVIEPILKEEGIPDDFKFIAAIESNFDNVVSPAGASGYWQFLKSTGQSYGLEVNSFVDERYHVEKSTRAACKYFKDAYKLLGNWTLVAAAYNMGTGGVQQKVTEQQTTNYYNLYLNTETHRYVFRVLAAKEIFKNPSFYGFNVRPKDMYPPYETKLVEIDSTIASLNDFAIKNNTNLKILKLLNPWLRDSSLPNKGKKKYSIKLPADGFDLKPITP